MHQTVYQAGLKQEVTGGSVFSAKGSAMLTQGFGDQDLPPLPLGDNSQETGKELRGYIFGNISGRGTYSCSPRKKQTRMDVLQNSVLLIMTLDQCHSK